MYVPWLLDPEFTGDLVPFSADVLAEELSAGLVLLYDGFVGILGLL